MKNIIALRREDLSKKGEQRTAITPLEAAQIIDKGYELKVQGRSVPGEETVKRIFEDEEYQAVGAQLGEDVGDAQLVIGLKEVETAALQPDKAYVMFSHTHKGQIKNRPLLKKLIENRNTLIDYELLLNSQGQRALTAFTYFAGYAGMVDSLWTFGKRLAAQGIPSPFGMIAQSITYGDLGKAKAQVRALGARIAEEGTPENLPPVIIGILGNGKTSTGAQEILDELPVSYITPQEVVQVFAEGSRKRVYAVILKIPDMYRVKPEFREELKLEPKAFFSFYLENPDYFESNMEGFFPYLSLLMNCILWSPIYPRLLSYADMQVWYAKHKTLQVVGDITCDPEGAIQFSRETWIDDPVFVYDPASHQWHQGFEGEGIAVMAVTNLPCEFSADASRRFSEEFSPYLLPLLEADFSAETPEAAGFTEALTKATILWRGAFTPAYAYMQEYVAN